jgi:hypothetical protein
MGFSPRQVDEMSLWEFAACTDGFNRAHGGDEKPEPPTEAEFYDMLERLGD